MLLTKVVHLIVQLASAVDSGKYQSISTADIDSAAKDKRVLRFLKEKTTMDISNLLDSPFEAEFEDEMWSMYDCYGGPNNKLRIDNSGLLLLIDWSAHLLQTKQDIEFDKLGSKS